MPAILRESIPWLRVDPHRIYAVGGSMGGQETLLLAAQHPGLLAGAVTFDAPTDLARRYQQVGTLPNAGSLRALMRLEVGGTPDELPEAYADRSPLHFAQALADSGVPLEMWWSTRDELVVNQRTQCGRLFAELKRLNPGARVVSVVGTWPHVAELRWDRGLPRALHFLGVPHAE
jgi:pimeloyl-ACP methyl ester carboxylesterase